MDDIKDLGLLELAYVKALDNAHLTRAELEELSQAPASELLLLGSMAEAVVVRNWTRREEYRMRAQDLQDGKRPEDANTSATRTFPFYVSD
tara:strand:- start:65 stop:337 length:273 start_codon:yes stop_codon:yes gene_type:complete